jgi:predicted acetyltransferase
VTVELRYARPDELAPFLQSEAASFGFQWGEEEIPDALLGLDSNTVLVAVEGDQLVGSSAEVPFDMTLPGGALVGVTGLSWVGVEITHRRQGIARQLMEQQVHRCAERGSTALILCASQGDIYGRYGYGAATLERKTSVDRRAARIAHPLDDHGVRRLTTEQARDVLPAIHDRWRRSVPGGLDRNARRWTLRFLDHGWQRPGMSALFHLVHADGYVSYRVRHVEGPTGAENVCVIIDYAPITAEAHAALWQVLLGMDLFAQIDSIWVPVDDPLQHLLTDERQVTTRALIDGLWLRPLDIPALLGARRYAVEIDVAVRVRDRLLGDATYRLTGGPHGASCVATGDSPDLELDVADLGSLSLGGRRLTPLVRAGRVRCADDRLAGRLDRALLGDVAPQFGTPF